MGRKLSVIKSEMVNVNYHWIGAFRLQLTVNDAVGMEKEVFLYHRHPINPNTGDQLDTFTTVCSAVDMADFPVNDPLEEQPFPFYRSDTVILDFRSLQEFNDGYTDLMARLENLVAALDAMDDLTPTQTIWIGGEPENTETSSETA